MNKRCQNILSPFKHPPNQLELNFRAVSLCKWRTFENVVGVFLLCTISYLGILDRGFREVGLFFFEVIWEQGAKTCFSSTSWRSDAKDSSPRASAKKNTEVDVEKIPCVLLALEGRKPRKLTRLLGSWILTLAICRRYPRLCRTRVLGLARAPRNWNASQHSK